MQWIFIDTHIYDCIGVFGGAGSLLLRGLPPVAESRAGPRVAVFGLPTVVASLVGERGLQACGPQRFPLAGFRAQVPYLRQKRLVALQRVGSSWISCVGRWTPPH